jgi:hypothetical protein
MCPRALRRRAHARIAWELTGSAMEMSPALASFAPRQTHHLAIGCRRIVWTEIHSNRDVVDIGSGNGDYFLYSLTYSQHSHQLQREHIT